MKKTKLMLGDNVQLLKKLPENSIDSVVTDPPYGLSFMNKKWDYDVPSVEFWKEVWRVLKPGGHILSFGGTRTYHRMVVNIEDAGFEIRDQIQWIYSTGFPKSLNVKKQFDKNGYKVCECSEQNTEHDLRPLRETNISQTINAESEQGETLLQDLYEQDIQRAFPSDIKGTEQKEGTTGREEPSVEEWSNSIQEEGQLQGNNIQESTRTSERNGEEGWLYNGTQNDNGSNGKQIIDENRSGSSYRPQSEQQSSKQSGTMADKRRPQESGSRKICNRCGEQIILGLDNLGTALKPANEPICVARKPLSEKSVAENVLKWGTGGINIDGCRIGNEIIRTDLKNTEGGVAFNDGNFNRDLVGYKYNEGRFPANIILDETAAELLDEQSGVSGSGSFKKSGTRDRDKHDYNSVGNFGSKKGGILAPDNYGDKGGASRFFYVAKVAKKERNMGLDEFEEKETKGIGLHSVGETPTKDNNRLQKNTHPTVKPINLMTYLCRLITPKNGIVLDPFMGSGSTGISAQLEGFRFVGMEMDSDYFKIAETRIENWEKYKKLLKKND